MLLKNVSHVTRRARSVQDKLYYTSLNIGKYTINKEKG